MMGSSGLDIPEYADTGAGADFFAQYRADLFWATSTTIVARDLNYLVDMIGSTVGEMDPDKWAKEADLTWTPDIALVYFAGYAERAEHVRSVTDRAHAELMLCRCVDNLLTYFTDLLKMIFEVRPQILKRSGLTVTVAELLEYSTISDAVSELADRKVHDLSYKGLGELKDFFKRNLGLDLVDPVNDQGLTLAIESRNLLTHKRGRVDKRFLEKIRTDALRVGERLDLGPRIFPELIPLILRVVRELDARAAAKFGFSTAFVLPSDPPASALPYEWLRERRGATLADES
ncbi:hypothetical protein ACWGID_29340 [Kribbella sp. NPDC054772]